MENENVEEVFCRIYPTKEQEDILNRHFDAVRFVYNEYLRRKMQYGPLGGGEKDSAEEFESEYYLDSYPWLTELDANVVISAVNEVTYDLLMGLLDQLHNKYPAFKTDAQTLSYCVEGPGNFITKDSKIDLPNVGEVAVETPQYISREVDLYHLSVHKVPTGKFYISMDEETRSGELENEEESDAYGLLNELRSLLNYRDKVNSKKDKLEKKREKAVKKGKSTEEIDKKLKKLDTTLKSRCTQFIETAECGLCEADDSNA